jgi:hypothetical protein
MESKGRTRKLLLTLLVLGLVGMVAGFGTFASFSGTTDNSGNSFQAGTVYLDDNDASCAMYQAPAPSSGACAGVTLDASNKAPNGSVQACIRVRYLGSLAADVKMYWTPASSGDTLSQYLNLKIERGTQASPSFPSCTGFTAATSGTVTLYNSTLSTFNTSSSPLSGGYPGAQTAWNANDTQIYRITVTLNDDNNANGGASGSKVTGSHSFTWVATNQ